MKNLKHIISVSLLLLLGVSLTACSFDHDDSGKLGGFWHLVTIEDGAGVSTDVSQQLIFWSIEGKIFQVEGKGMATYIFHYNRSGDNLLLTEPRQSDRENGDPTVSDASILGPYGITSLTPTYHIDALNGSKMVLSESARKLYFRKQ